MYLAEDRILCFEIVTKKREGWTYVSSRLCVGYLTITFSLKYVKSAQAATDVPTTVSKNLPLAAVLLSVPV